MKKILFAAFALLSILPSISAQKERVTFDTATKKLTILTEVEIDTAALYAKRAKLDDKITKLTAARQVAVTERDTVISQIKTASKLMRGKKGGGNNRKAEAPPVQIFTAPECDSTYTIENGPVVVCWYDGIIRSVSYSKPPQKPKAKADKPKTKAKKQ